MANIPTIHRRVSQLSRPIRRSQKVTQSEHPADEEQRHSSFKERRRGDRRKHSTRVRLERRDRHKNRRQLKRHQKNESVSQETSERMGRHINTEA